LIEQYNKTPTVSYSQGIFELVTFKINFTNTNYNLSFTPDTDITTSNKRCGYIGSKNYSISQAYVYYQGAGSNDKAQFIKWAVKGY